MPMTTFLYDSDLNVPTSNKELNEMLKEIRSVTGENWQIIEREKRRLFRRLVKVYELYVEVGGIGPFQVINFYRENTGTSINESNSTELVMAYLTGILAGIQIGGRKDKK